MMQCVYNLELTAKAPNWFIIGVFDVILCVFDG